MTNINIELSEKYKEHLDLLKQVIPNKEGKQVESDSEMVEVLIEEFIAFVQQHAAAQQESGGCCGGEGHDHSHEGHTHEEGKGGCGCSH